MFITHRGRGGEKKGEQRSGELLLLFTRGLCSAQDSATNWITKVPADPGPVLTESGEFVNSFFCAAARIMMMMMMR